MPSLTSRLLWLQELLELVLLQAAKLWQPLPSAGQGEKEVKETPFSLPATDNAQSAEWKLQNTYGVLPCEKAKYHEPKCREEECVAQNWTSQTPPLELSHPQPEHHTPTDTPHGPEATGISNTPRDTHTPTFHQCREELGGVSSKCLFMAAMIAE